MDVEREIQELKRRVGDLEGAVSVLSGQVGKVHPDLQAHSQNSVKRFDRIEELMTKVSGRIDLLNSQVWSLRDDLLSLVADAIRGGSTKDE